MNGVAARAEKVIRSCPVGEVRKITRKEWDARQKASLAEMVGMVGENNHG
jgi:hypothetical protein